MKKVLMIIKKKWSECLLRIINVSNEIYPIYYYNNNTSTNEEEENDYNYYYNIASTLWNSNDNIPKHCKAIIEIQVELLTGRTHQIRGQLSKLGYPIVGDVLYGGAISSEYNDEYITLSTYRNLSHSIALQCCQLS